MLENCPALSDLIAHIDSYFQRTHPAFFGTSAIHPVLPVKRAKVIHDNVWGTNRFHWRELVLIDSPIIQRLRGIHQIGLAYYVYPSAGHTRFEHCLGTLTIASRIFDAVIYRHRDDVRTIANSIEGSTTDSDKFIRRLKQELRLAALMHDVGHSLFSHASEHVYKDLQLIKDASRELSDLIGKEKGAGEVLSFCTALTNSVTGLLKRAETNLIGETQFEDYDGPIDIINIALIIVGRARHPFLQFLGDIVSSGFDADKLDYLLRDAVNAGLPLRYDLDRYMYLVRLEKNRLADSDNHLKNLYSSVGSQGVRRTEKGLGIIHPYYDTYRLRLPKQAMNVIEQIVICKMMLFTYIYHHPKARAAEGILERMLVRMVKLWKTAGETDKQILNRFMDMTDSALHQPICTENVDEVIKDYSYRLANRLLPREVYRLSSSDASHAERQLLTDFLTSLQDRQKGPQLISDLEAKIGEELLRNSPSLGDSEDVVRAKVGLWVDLPKAIKFEDIDEIVTGRSAGDSGVPLSRVFPIGEWTQAYTYYRYYVRIFAFSDYWQVAEKAAKDAMKKVIKIESESFYKSIKRTRE